jgi:hypothetical protein
VQKTTNELVANDSLLRNFFNTTETKIRFPNLEDGTREIIGHMSGVYNCRAYACGVTDLEIPITSVQGDRDFLEGQGFTHYDLHGVTDEMLTSPTSRTIAVYTKDGAATHYSVYNSTERIWESKLGISPLIRHQTLEQLNNSGKFGYGQATDMFYNENINVDEFADEARAEARTLNKQLDRWGSLHGTSETSSSSSDSSDLVSD